MKNEGVKKGSSLPGNHDGARRARVWDPRLRSEELAPKGLPGGPARGTVRHIFHGPGVVGLGFETACEFCLASGVGQLHLLSRNPMWEGFQRRHAQAAGVQEAQIS